MFLKSGCRGTVKIVCDWDSCGLMSVSTNAALHHHCSVTAPLRLAKMNTENRIKNDVSQETYLMIWAEGHTNYDTFAILVQHTLVKL